ncbi:MAG: putative ABC transporter permease [Eubacterium sp.]
MTLSFYNMALLFFIYSFIGWCIEVAFVAVTVGKVENRGFLNGPVCPIYGCGMLGVLMALMPISDKWILLFIGGMAICTAVELFGGWILDKIFHMRWWDYTDKPFNIGGYVCLGFSIMWGIAVVFAVRMVHPFIMAGVNKIPHLMGNIIICLLIAVFSTDMIVTLKNLIGIKKNLGQLDKIADELHNIGDQLKDMVGNSAITVAEMAGESIDIAEAKEKLDNVSEATKEKIDSVSEATKEKFDNVSGATKEKLDNVSEATREKIAAQMEELEARKDALIENIQKSSKHILNALPKLNKSGKSINIKEYINLLKWTNKNQQEKEEK